MRTSVSRLIKILFASFVLSACNKYDGSIPVDFILDSSDKASISSSPTFVYTAKFYSLDVPYEEGQKTPMVIYASDNGRLYFWLKLRPLGNWNKQDRVEEVAKRLDLYRIEKMDRLAWGTRNNQNIICAYTAVKPDECQIVVTVPKEINPEEVLILLQCKRLLPDDPKCSAPIDS